MGMIWDSQKHADAVAEEARLKGLLAEVSLRMHDEHASDKQWDEGRLARYGADGVRHRQLTDEIRLLAADRRALELLEPQAVRKSEVSPFVRWLRRGDSGLEDAERKIMLVEADGDVDSRVRGSGFRLLATPLRPRLATASDAASGQEAVQEMVAPTIVDTLSYYGGVSKAAYSFTTTGGGEYRWPHADAADQEGEIEGSQGNAASDLDLPDISPAARPVEFGAKTGNSRWIKLTREMMTDAGGSGIDIESYAHSVALRRLGRSWNKHFTVTQTGAGMPIGVVNAATGGVVAAAQETITWTEMINLQFGINRAYRERDEAEGEFSLASRRMGGMTGFMISDTAERAMLRMADGDQRPVWIPSLREGRPNTFAGWPYVVNGHMAELAAGSVSVLFGNFSYYGIRNVGSMEYYQFWDSNTARNRETWCIAYSRRDGRPIGALSAAGVCEAWAKLTQAA